MTDFKELIAMTKNLGSARGALIQLEEDLGFITNVKRSVVYELKFDRKIGTGTFYASEIPPMSENIERRDDNVLFSWKEKGESPSIFVPNKKSFDVQSKTIFEKYYEEPNIKAPTNFIERLDGNILITSLRINRDEILTNQKRSDGTVGFTNKVKLKRGLAEAENHPDSGEVSIFTQDIYVLKGFVRDPLYIELKEKKPISIRGSLTFGAVFRGIIAYLEYE